MKIKPQYSVLCDDDGFSLTERLPDGTMREAAPLSATAGMAIEGFMRGLSRDALIDAIVGEFDGADRDTVSADLDALAAQLIALGYAEE